MNWFAGNISEAITSAKSQKHLFVVAVYGTTDADSFLSMLDGVSPMLNDGCVCIKLEEGSTLANQFSQIYPIEAVPSLYFIDSENGNKLKIVSGSDISPDGLAAAVKSVKESRGAPALSSPRSNRVEEAQKVLKESAASPMPESGPSESKPTTALSLEERVARAKELLAKRQTVKANEVEDTEKIRELERREMGKKVLEMKREQQDKDLAQAAKDRKRDKEEEKEARERVKKAIEQDRAERNIKFNQEKEARLAALKEQERLKKEAEVEEANKLAALRGSSSRIQFRLPDGRSQTHTFDADDKLQNVYQYVNEDMKGSPFKSFSLSTTFPTRPLDTVNRDESLRDLGLVPTATILILPKDTTVAKDGGFFSFLALLFSPVIYIWNFVVGFLGLDSNPNPTPTPGGSAEPKRNRPSGSFRRDGNVARLGNQSDDEDDNNTWNGNSTQQQ